MIPTAELPSPQQAHAIEVGANVALQLGALVVVLGMSGDTVAMCVKGCCTHYRGARVIVPDSLEVEYAANGKDLVSDGGVRVQLEGHRSVLVFMNRGGDG